VKIVWEIEEIRGLRQGPGPPFFAEKNFKAIPHNSARANPEKKWVLMMALFRRNTLCIARKSDEIRALFFQEAPKADCAGLH
jgi:hypothetical protein